MPDQSLFRIEPSLAGKRRECAAFARSPFTTGVLIYSICALVAFGLIYAGTQQVARKATVSGRAELTDGELKLYPNARRLVAQVKVKEGQRVERGQLLAVLHGLQHAPSSGTGEPSGYQRMSHSLMQQASRLQESRNDVEQSATIEQDKLRSKRRFLKQAQRSLKQSAITAVELLEIASEQHARGAELYKSGHLSLSDFEELQRRELQQKASIAENERTELNFKEQLRALEHEVQTLTKTRQANLRDVDTRLGENARERERLQMSFEQHLLAPSTGFITGVLKQAGATASPQAPLITMVRTKSAYRARLWAGSHAAGELEVGQSVNLMLDAFPHQKHGMLSGEITHINVSPLTLSELDVPWEGGGSAYSVTVNMDTTNPLYRRIKPGMNLTADIKLDKSLLVARLFEPLLLAWQRAL